MFNKITLGPITVYMYGLMIAIGFASALFLCNYRGKKRGLSEDTIFGIFLCALIGGMVGCRLLYYIVELPAIMEDPSILWDFKKRICRLWWNYRWNCDKLCLLPYQKRKFYFLF